MAAAARQAGAAAVAHVASKDQVLGLLNEAMHGGDVVLIKGSNSAGLFATAAALATQH